MDDLSAEWAIGERIKRLRKAALMTQDDLAAAAGVSTDLIRKLEQGRRHTASIVSLHRIARALDIDLGGLLSRDNLPEAAPDAGVVALRHAVAEVTDLLHGIEGNPPSLREAQRTLTYLSGAYWGGKYEQLTGLIPQALNGLRAGLHAADAATRPTATEYLAWGYSWAASTLTQLHQVDAAFLAARRAVDLAQSGADELLVARFTGGVSWQLMVDGRFQDAEQVALHTAQSIEPSGETPLQHLSSYGSLLLTAATAAARDRRSDVAGDLLGSAAEVAARVGTDRMDYETPFGPSQVAMQTVDVGVVTEDYPAALDAVTLMPANPGLPLAAHCRHLTDRACAHANLSQDEQALTLLLTAESMGPDWIRHQNLARAVTRDLLIAERRRSTPLRDLALRIGVTRWDTVS